MGSTEERVVAVIMVGGPTKGTSLFHIFVIGMGSLPPISLSWKLFPFCKFWLLDRIMRPFAYFRFSFTENVENRLGSHGKSEFFILVMKTHFVFSCISNGKLDIILVFFECSLLFL